MDEPLNAPLQSTPLELEVTLEQQQNAELEKAPMPTTASDYIPLIKFFGIENVDQDTQGKLQTVWEHYAKDAKNPGTALNRIKQQLLNMPQPNMGDNRLNMLNNYVRVLQDLDSVKDMKRAFEK